MATALLVTHVARALDFYKHTDLFYALGRITTPWESESAPPTPDENSAFIEPLGYKEVSTKYLVVLDDVNGDITYLGHKWRAVDVGDAVSEQAHHVYVEAVVAGSELPLTSYRQVAVISGLVRAEGVALGKTNLLPEEVSDSGIVEVLDNRPLTPRTANQQETFCQIVEF